MQGGGYGQYGGYSDYLRGGAGGGGGPQDEEMERMRTLLGMMFMPGRQTPSGFIDVQGGGPYG
jgi:hypothetical protein